MEFLLYGEKDTYFDHGLRFLISVVFWSINYLTFLEFSILHTEVEELNELIFAYQHSLWVHVKVIHVIMLSRSFN